MAIIERNVFTGIKTEDEIVSAKANRIHIRGNSFLQCVGGAVLRHGRDSRLQSNYFVDKANTTGSLGTKSGGIRFYDSGHIVEDNYMEGLASTGAFQRPIIIDTGDAEGTSTNLAAHWRVVGATVQRNVIIACPSGIHIGDNYALAPDSIGVQNNDVINSGGAAVTTLEPAVGDSIIANNTYFATTTAGGYTAASDSIYRKTGRGPKVTYLDPTDVGPTADLSDTDRTGATV